MTRHGFNNDWSIKTRKPIPDQRFSFSYGHSFRLGNGADLALNGALNYSYATRTFSNMENSRYGVYNKVEDKPEYYYKYTDDQYQTNVKVGALLNLAYLNGKNRYYFRNIFNQIGQDKLTLREGWQNMSSLYIHGVADKELFKNFLFPVHAFPPFAAASSAIPSDARSPIFSPSPAGIILHPAV